MVTHNILASQAKAPLSPSQLTSRDSIWLFYTVTQCGSLNKYNPIG